MIKLKYFLFFVILILFTNHVFALETTTVYRNSSLSTTGFLYTTDSSLSGSIKNGVLNTVYADPSYGITFFINKGTVSGKAYKVRINFNDYDYLKNNNHNRVTVTNGDNCSVIGFQLLNQGGSNNQAKGVDITYTCLSAGSYTGFQLGEYVEGTGYARITTIDWRINNVQWEQLDDNQASEIIANATINTNNIINNNNENTQDIINNQDSNTQDIIDNQNQNTKDLQNTINDNFQNCHSSSNLFIPRSDFSSGILSMSNGIITLNGTLESNTSFRVGNITANSGSYTINPNKTGNINNSYFYFYIEGTAFSFSDNKNFSLNSSLDNEAVWLVLTRGNYDNVSMSVMLNEGNISLPYEPYGKTICINRLDETNQSINDLNDSLNDSDVDNSKAIDTLEDLSSSLPTNSVISDLLLLPVRMLQAIVNSIGGNCSSFNLGSLYGTNLILPCINIQSYVGSGIWTFIDIVFSATFVIVIRKKFIQIFENITNLRNGGNEVE